jgi:hypothetical protein
LTITTIADSTAPPSTYGINDIAEIQFDKKGRWKKSYALVGALVGGLAGGYISRTWDDDEEPEGWGYGTGFNIEQFLAVFVGATVGAIIFAHASTKTESTWTLDCW